MVWFLYDNGLRHERVKVYLNIAGKLDIFYNNYYVGNNIKGQISNRVLQENKARQIFRKTIISYSLIRTRDDSSYSVI